MTVSTNKLLKRKIHASLKFQSNFETSRELLRKIFSRSNTNREAHKQPPSYWNQQDGRIDASDMIPMLQHMV